VTEGREKGGKDEEDTWITTQVKIEESNGEIK
jgi:hypothetical protein